MISDRFRVRLESSDFPCDDLQVFEITGTEAIGQLFSFTIAAITTSSGELDVGQVEGASAALVLVDGDEEVRRLHGMIAEVEDMLDTQPETRTYRMVLVPRAHRLSLVLTQEIFMDLSVPEIIQRKFELVELGTSDVEMRLHSSYEQREYVVQYKETDLAFVSRLAEREGISLSFEHRDGRDVAVFTDDNRSFPVDERHAAATFQSRGERCDVWSLRSTTRVTPRVHVVHDYNYRIPLVDPTGSAEAPSGHGGGLVEYGAHVKTPEEAKRIAQVRAEATEVGHRVYTLESDLAWMSAGASFTLEGHPRLGSLPLLVTHVEHQGRFTVALHGGHGDQRYANTVRAIDAGLPFRPPRRTPRPSIQGVLNGVIAHEVEGTETIFARLDDQGRYLVRMMFDTSEPSERPLVSRRIRMSQAHAGANYGEHLPLKPGTEVLVSFVDGDPDRPVIVASVPNPITPSPVAANCAPAHRIKTATGILIEMKDA